MKHFALPMVAVSLLGACNFSLQSNNDINNVVLNNTGTESASQSIERYEQLDGSGGGYAEAISYDATTDTFKVDNLPFDGNNGYARGTAVSDLGPFMVFDGDATQKDPLDNDVIDQFLHRAIYGISTSGDVEFGIVRTGEYADYGFGGFVYLRDGGVTIPTKGQANYDGKYAGLRVFSGNTGIELTEADANLAVDFRDFNTGYAIKGTIYNRVAYDKDGGVLTTAGDVLSGEVHLPDIKFKIAPGVMSDNGIIQGQLASYALDTDGITREFEAGNYYGVMAGANGDEIVGVIVVESKDPRFGDPFNSTNDVFVQETGGFIVYR
jgi:hypothetical protein